jgi:type IV pilus assembly protein PilQ
MLFLCLGAAGTLERIPDAALVDSLRRYSTTIRGENLQVNLLLRAIGRKAGVHVIVDGGITDVISFDLDQVNLYDLFQLVMKTKDLNFYESNKALIVEKMADFRKDQRDVITVKICPKYGEAEQHLQELEFLKSEDGTLAATADGNCLIVRDHQSDVEKINNLLDALDRPTPQVHIRARIVTIDKSTSRQLGIKWGYTDLENLPADSLTAAADLSVLNPTSSIVFGFIRDTFTLDLELSALQEKNKLHVLSEPRIVVLDGEEAEIKQGKEVPYESGTRENRNTSFREAVLSLKVIPKILRDNFLKIDVKVTNDSVDEKSTEDGQPLLNRQEIRTSLFLEDGVTVVIGGILAKGTDATNGEVPWFADLPLIGGLFKNVDELDRTFELLVFLTPSILKGEDVLHDRKKTIDLLEGEMKTLATENIDTGLSADTIPSLSPKLMLHPLEMQNQM